MGSSGNKHSSYGLAEIKHNITKRLNETAECFTERVSEKPPFPLSATKKFTQMEKRFHKAWKLRVEPCPMDAQTDRTLMLLGVSLEKQQVCEEFSSLFNKVKTLIKERKHLYFNMLSEISRLQEKMRTIKNPKRYTHFVYGHILEWQESVNSIEMQMEALAKKWEEMQLLSRITYLYEQLLVFIRTEGPLGINMHDDEF